MHRIHKEFLCVLYNMHALQSAAVKSVTVNSTMAAEHVGAADKRCDRDHSTCDGRTETCIGRGPAWPDHFSSNEIIATRQARHALNLWESANQTLSGTLHLKPPVSSLRV